MDVTAIVTAHSEGILLAPALRSAGISLQAAREAGLECELVLILDNATSVTNSVAKTGLEQIAGLGFEVSVHETRHGDPAGARNSGVEKARGEYVSFLDGDDLWGSNWIVQCHQYYVRENAPLILHSHFNIVFGSKRVLWVHPDARKLGRSLASMAINNLWDAMCFAPRAVFEETPFKANALKQGYGHEDWHWNLVTLGNGLFHAPCPGTVHFKRSRKGSQMALCDDADVVPWDAPLAHFSNYANLGTEGETR